MSRRIIGLAVALAWGSSAAQTVPALTGRVVDNADILDDATESEITALFAAHEDSTGNQIAILTIPALNGSVLEEYATLVFRTWALGEAGRNNGVLILIARDDRKIRIEVGFGLEGSLTDGRAGAIIRNEMTPRFRDGDFNGGALAAAEAVVGSIRGTYVAEEGGGVSDFPPFVGLILMFTHGLIPGFLAFRALVQPPWARYPILAFTTPFVALAATMAGSAFLGLEPFKLGIAAAIAYWMLFILADIVATRSPTWQEKRAHQRRKAAAFKKARMTGQQSVFVDGRAYSVPTSSGSSGFSGGGGSSGGGGASGGW